LQRRGGTNRAGGFAGGFLESAMSLSVNGSNSNNSYLQSLLQQNQSPSSTAQSDPLDALLSALGQGTGTTSSATGTTSSTSGATATSSNSTSQFGPQTLQALFAMQANSSNSSSLLSQLNGDNAAGSGDPSSAQSSAQASGQSSRHHRHHRTGETNSSNPSGSGSNGTSNNLVDQLMQMQSQLTNPAPTQSLATV
jgi:hypothetical protein